MMKSYNMMILKAIPKFFVKKYSDSYHVFDKEVKMKLEDCKRRDVNLAELARLIDYQHGYVCSIVHGRYKAGRKFLKALENISLESVTKKYVTQKDKTNDE